MLFREDATVDDLIDVIEVSPCRSQLCSSCVVHRIWRCSLDWYALQNNRKYLRCLYVVNKCDMIGLDEVDKYVLHVLVIRLEPPFVSLAEAAPLTLGELCFPGWRTCPTLWS